MSSGKATTSVSKVQDQCVIVLDPIKNKENEILLSKDGTLRLATLKRALPGAYGLNYKNQKTGRVRAVDFDEKKRVFLEPSSGWTGKTFEVIFKDKRERTPFSKLQKRLAAPSEFAKYLFVIKESNKIKSCATFVKTNFFVTYRHGKHKEYVRDETVVQVHSTDGRTTYDTMVRFINEPLDFVLLQCIHEMDLIGPPLCQDECEGVYIELYGMGNIENRESFNHGFSHRMQIFTEPKEKGPFMFGTIDASKGDSGAVVFDGCGLFGINLGYLSFEKEPKNNNFTEIATSIKNSATFPQRNYMVTTRYILLAINHVEGLEIKKIRKRDESRDSGELKIDGVVYS